MTPLWEIVTRERDDRNPGPWSTEGIGDANEFESAEEAVSTIETLRTYGPDWARSQYGVRVVGSGHHDVVLVAEGKEARRCEVCSEVEECDAEDLLTACEREVLARRPEECAD